MPTASDTLLQSQATGYLLGAPLLPQKSPHLLPRLFGVTNAPTLSISPRRGIAFRHLGAIVPVAGAAVSSAPPENGTGATTDRSTHLGDRFAAFPEKRKGGCRDQHLQVGDEARSKRIGCGGHGSPTGRPNQRVD